MYDISYNEFKKMFLDGNVEVIDVREKDEFDLIKIKGSKLIPLDEVMDRLEEIDWNKKVILVCRTGSRSAYVGRELVKLGKEVFNLEKGIRELYLEDSELVEHNDKEVVDRYFL